MAQVIPPLRILKATAAKLASYVGSLGEPVFNTDEQRLVMMDGTTPGGVPHAKLSELEAFTMPSASYICGLSPLTYRRPELFSPERTEVVVPAHTWVTVGGRGLVSTKDTYLSLSDFDLSGQAGKDAYLYACWPAAETDTEPVFVLSANSTVPDGYDADSSRKIGGFHQLCASVGTIGGHTLSGWATGEILPLSAWDLLHRSVSANEGTVCLPDGNWWDIYLPSWDGEKLVSVFGGVPVTGYSSMPMHGERFAEYFGKIGKRLMFRDEFVYAAKGSNECTAIQGEANPGDTGGHVDTAGRRMISNYGIEDCCGAFWQRTSDVYAFTNYDIQNDTYATLNNALWKGNVQRANHYCSLMRWDLYEADPAYGGTEYNGSSNQTGHSRIYHVDIDGDDTDKFGDMYGGLGRALVGAYWGSGVRCGSRAVLLPNLSSYRHSGFAGRGVAGPRAVGPF